jgi:hypothetical protein
VLLLAEAVLLLAEAVLLLVDAATQVKCNKELNSVLQ